MRDVAEVTGFPEMMDGRVKTLHPKVHGGLLALRDDDEHLVAMAAHGIEPIDLLVVNLYPFEATVARGADYATCIENIDIGGPAMIRAAAKNHRFVTVVTDPADYAALLAELAAHDGATTLAFRQKLALTAYSRTAAYDAAVSTWMAGALQRTDAAPPRLCRQRWRRRCAMARTRTRRRRSTSTARRRPGVATARQWQGKELSYNNINDTDAAFELVAEFAGEGPACAIIKHANPCGVARGATLAEAYQRAYDCDRTSAFGGIVALNQPLDGADGGRDRRDLHRGRHRPRRGRRGAGGLRRQEEPAPADHRRPARSAGEGRSPSSRWRAAFWCRTATRAASRRPT